MTTKADMEGLASLLEGSGLMEAMGAMSGGKRSHKGQYVRWLIGQQVKANPKSRVGDVGKINYKKPYAPFEPSRVQKQSVSERFGTVARSKFIDRMLASEKRKVKPKVAPRLVVEEVAEVEEDNVPAGEINTAEELRRYIIEYSNDGLTTRGILAKIQSDHTRRAGVPLSQPTITRVVKKYREGGYNEDGSVKK